LGIWSKVIMLVAWALIAFAGHWPLWVDVSTGVLVFVAIVYLIYRENKGFSVEFVPGNLLRLFPGHLLLLFGLSLAEAPPLAAWVVWAGILAGTFAFDTIVQSAIAFEVKKRLAMVFYGVVWGGIFLLIYQVVASGGKLEGSGMVIFIVVLVAAALAYVGLALYRFSKLQPLGE